MQIIHSKIKTKLIVLLILLVSAMLLFSGCYDLGKFKDTEDYCNSFGDVRLINQGVTDNFKDYNFANYFYNEKSINDFAGDIVDADEYIYMVLPVRNNFKLGEFSIYLKPEKSGLVYYSIYISDSIPVNIRRYTDPKSKQKTDSDNNPIFDEEGNPVMEDIEYGDLSIDNCIYQGSVNLVSNKWDSFTAKLTTKTSTEINTNYVSDGEYIVVRFENNSGLGKDKGYEKIPFSLTNILIRAV